MVHTPPLPFDVRLMNGVAAVLFAGAALALIAIGLSRLAAQPLFAIRSIRVDGDVARNNVATIRANAVPKLSGNFFSLDLDAARRAFESVPWVRSAVVRRVWPNALQVSLVEHRAAAFWHRDEGDDQLVDVQGEVFEANPGDVEDDGLPTLQGPEGTAAAMLALYRRLAPVFAALDVHIDTLRLSGRGSWFAELDSGAQIELGRGSDDDIDARAARFARTLGQVTARYQRPLQYADLRHTDGYALRLRGVSTTTPASAAAGAKH